MGKLDQVGDQKKYGELVLEVEQAVEPLGFRITDTNRREHAAMFSGDAGNKPDEDVVSITIVRKGRLA